jgi:RHS repeat-associated protein
MAVDLNGNSIPYKPNTREEVQFFYHSDQINSTNYITDRYSALYQRIEYLPFGEVMFEERALTPGVDYLFSGKELDAESGFNYFSQRYYFPKLAIFTGFDKLWDKYPNWNPLQYCYNNPIRFVDPTGMIVEPTDDAQVNNRINPEHKDYNKEFHELYKKLDGDQNTVYSFNRGKPQRKEDGSMGYGSLTCNGKNEKGQDLISINYTYGESGIFSNEFFLFEETAHAGQFMNGDFGFQLQDNGKYEAFAVDRYDEASAKLWAAQNVTNPKSIEEKKILNSNVRGNIEGTANPVRKTKRKVRIFVPN